MDRRARGLAALAKAEAELKQLLTGAATAGDYSEVVVLASWARSIRDLLGAPRAVPQSLAATNAPGPSAGKAKRGTPAPGKAEAQTTYPQFYRQGDRLVRVAWSKRDKKEYEHRAPRAVIDATCDVIAYRGANGRVFSTEEILPITDGAGSSIPGYQVYAALALLKQVGLLDQHGRQGYSIAHRGDLKTAIDAVWGNLPKR